MVLLQTQKAKTILSVQKHLFSYQTSVSNKHMEQKLCN